MEIAQQGNGARISGGLEVKGTGRSIVANPLIASNINSESGIDINSAASKHITLGSGGDIILDAGEYAASDGIFLKAAGTTFATFNVHHSASYITFYENGGASTSDYLQIAIKASGETTITTYDAAGSDADLMLNIDGDITLDCHTGKDIIIQENGGTYTPSADTHVATKKYVDDNAGGTVYWMPQFSGRFYTRNLNWYFPSSSYGATYFNWSGSSGSTSLPTALNDGWNPMITIPKACTLTDYTFQGNFTNSQTYEVALLYGTKDNGFGAAGDYSLTQVGATQSQVATSAYQYQLGQSGLSVALAAGGVLMPVCRRTTTDTTSVYYFEMVFSFIAEVG